MRGWLSPPSGGGENPPSTACGPGIFIIGLIQEIQLRSVESKNKETDMTLVDFLILAVVAAVCGMVGESLAGYSVGGCLTSAVIGYIGAFIGLWVARQFGLPELFTVTVSGTSIPIVWSIIGSALLVAALSIIRRATI
jgi:uncharacterized membrane protein YeaQ/YmgE (transglycosylase-associated protein family)